MRSSTILSLVTALSTGLTALAVPVTDSEASLQQRDPANAPRPRPAGPGGRGGAGADVGNAINDLIEGAKKDKDRQSQFTQTMANELVKKFPHKNVVIYHDQSSEAHFKGNYHSHKEIPLDAGPIDGTKGYEINVFDEGTFRLHGDGGYVNWAFSGCVKKRDGNYIEFCKR